MGHELTEKQIEELFTMIATYLTDNGISVDSACAALTDFITMTYAFNKAFNVELITLEDAAELIAEGV